MRPVSSNKKLNNSESSKSKNHMQSENNTTGNYMNGSKSKISSKRANSAKNKLGLIKNSRRPINKNPIIEYNSLTENPINERTALYSTWTPLSDETTNQKASAQVIQRGDQLMPSVLFLFSF